jgi:pyruvate,water dikinase
MSLLELYNQLNPIGVNIPNGFAVTGLPFVSKRNNLEKSLDNILNLLDTKHYTNLSEVGPESQSIDSIAPIPYEIHA